MCEIWNSQLIIGAFIAVNISTRKIRQEFSIFFLFFCRLPHGRVQRLNGTYFDNVFVHFMPEKGK